ncbi:hypothetical protein B0H66DRAFT_311154 [Apodospora peruviana]|uniref:Uncharacterized protein n=1 Tax=Apodospora peruviana TaxID=516989 RepID=A0AAE0I256_9PEZI|nr:hypothetical protein B0H66DRAFT_311154 [Apodospora peruviana]
MKSIANISYAVLPFSISGPPAVTGIASRQVYRNCLEHIVPDIWREETELFLLATISAFETTLRHDKVYSVFALFKLLGIELPLPDYTLPISVVFESFVTTWIRSRTDLSIISLAIRNNDDVEGSNLNLPSWVPDWTQPLVLCASLDLEPDQSRPVEANIVDVTSAIILVHTAHRDAEKVRAAKESTLGSSTFLVPGKLHLEGYRVGTARVANSCPKIGDSRLHFPLHDRYYIDFNARFGEWCRMVSKMESYPTGEEPLAVLCYTTTADVT